MGNILPIWSELDPEAREEVYELKGMAPLALFVESRENSGSDDEQDERHGKPHCLHAFAAVGLVVDEQCRQVVADELTPDIDHVIKPKGKDLVRIRGYQR